MHAIVKLNFASLYNFKNRTASARSVAEILRFFHECEERCPPNASRLYSALRRRAAVSLAAGGSHEAVFERPAYAAFFRYFGVN